MTPLEKKQRLTEIKEQAGAIKKAKDLGKRSYTEEERATLSTLMSEKETLEAEVAKEALDADFDSKIETLASDLSQPAGRQTQPDALSTTRIEAVDDSERKKFKSLGEQLQAIAGASLSGRNDDRLKWENLSPVSGGAVANVPSDGGYLIQKDFSTALLGRMNSIGDIKSRVNVVPIGANSDGLDAVAVNETSRATGSRWGGVQVYWGAEADAATAKKPAFRKMQLELKDLIGLAYATNRLLRDASALQSIFMQAFSEEMNFMIEDSLINGSGAGMPLGILNCPAVVSVSKETGQGAATIVYENLVKMRARLWGRSRANAVWLINQDAEPQLDLLYQATGTGGVPANFITTDANGVTRIKGHPVVACEYAATLGTVGDIILADMSQVLAIEKDQMQADSSIHVRFTTNENTFRFIYRYDAQPTWNSALTPFKGSNTQSPFITLATRS